MGVTVKRNFALSDLPLICNYEVFSIFAHYSEKDSFIELADGLIPTESFVKALPQSFQGIYDLTACNSVWLRDAIKEKYPNQVIAFSSQLSATLMLVVYKNLICNLNKYDMNYIDCYTKMIVDLNAKCDE